MNALSPLPVTLRAMQDDDLPALTDMWVDSWRGVFPDIDFEARRAWFHGRLAAHRAGGVRIVVADCE